MFPEKTKLTIPKIVSKHSLLKQGKWTGEEKRKLTDEIQKIAITHQINEKTIRIPKGEEVSSIMVIRVELKSLNYTLSLVDKISRFFKFKTLFQIVDKNNENIWILPYHNGSIHENYTSSEDIDLKIEGVSLDEVYINLIHQIQKTKIGVKHNSVKNTVETMNELSDIEKKLSSLKDKMYKEKSIKKQIEIKKEYLKLKEIHKNIK